MENKLLRLCNKIYHSNFNFVEAIVLLEEDSCILSCMNRTHTVFFEMNVDLDYFQGKYVPTNKVHVILPEDVINAKVDLEKKLTEFEESILLTHRRLHHFFHEDHHEVSFKKFKKIAGTDCDKILIKCNECKSVFKSHYLKEPLLDIPDTFGLYLHKDEHPLSIKYSYDFFTVNAIVASRITPPDEAEIVFEGD